MVGLDKAILQNIGSVISGDLGGGISLSENCVMYVTLRLDSVTDMNFGK